MKSTHRSGYSLIEVLTVIAIATVLMPLVSQLFVQLIKLDRELRNSGRDSQTVYRFGQTLRDDVHAADLQTSSFSDDGKELKLSIEQNRSITYRHSNLGCERLVHVAGAVVHRELFRFAAADSMRWNRVQRGNTLFANTILNLQETPTQVEAAFRRGTP